MTIGVPRIMRRGRLRLKTFVFLRVGDASPWVAPAAGNLKVELLAGGQLGANAGKGTGGKSGYGGRYSKTSLLAVTLGQVIPFHVGISTGSQTDRDCWFGGTGLADAFCSADGLNNGVASIGDEIVAGVDPGFILGLPGGNAGKFGSVSWIQTSDFALAAPGAGGVFPAGVGGLFGGGGAGAPVGGSSGGVGGNGIIVLTLL